MDRRQMAFLGERPLQTVANTIDAEYDEVLEILVKAMLDEYNKGQCEALDIVSLKKGTSETEFERHMRIKR